MALDGERHGITKEEESTFQPGDLYGHFGDWRYRLDLKWNFIPAGYSPRRHIEDGYGDGRSCYGRYPAQSKYFAHWYLGEHDG